MRELVLDRERKPFGEESRDQLVLELSVAQKVNFASSQNGVSVLKNVVLQNLSDEPLENITLELTCSPGLIRPKNWSVDRLAPGQRQELRDLETPLDTVILGGLNEAEWEELQFVVKHGDTRSYRAPLLLVPVKISRKSAQSEFVAVEHT